MRMEYDLCAAPCGPADRFRITPTFMANCDTECQRAGLKNAPTRARRIGTFLGWVDLHFVLEARDRSVPIDHQCGDEQRTIDDPFGAEYDRKIRLRGSRSDHRPRIFEERRI